MYINLFSLSTGNFGGIRQQILFMINMRELCENLLHSSLIAMQDDNLFSSISISSCFSHFIFP